MPRVFAFLSDVIACILVSTRRNIEDKNITLFINIFQGFEEAMMEGPAQPPMGAVAGGGGDFMDLMSPDGAGGFNQFLDDNM